MSEDKREACARALFERAAEQSGRRPKPNWPVLSEHFPYTAEYWLAQVDAILAELRVPSEAMLVAGCRHENMGDMEGRWQAMIDAAGK